ncbi:hypothetical protein HMPREF1548_02356 [Clostridium sp. KLE 1755]|nr:hypothetical protein HMPREF1548_02356 [Clostridium sp. KLE 1755]
MYIPLEILYNFRYIGVFPDWRETLHTERFSHREGNRDGKNKGGFYP